MDTKSKFKLLSYLPYWTHKFMPMTSQVTVDNNKQHFNIRRFNRLHEDPWTYVQTRFEAYSYYQKDQFVFAEVMLSNHRKTGRMIAIAYNNNICFINPSESTLSFLDHEWHKTTINELLDIKWIAMDSQDEQMFCIDEKLFANLDFEDYISNNPLLTQSNIAFLFLKYK